MILRSTRQRQKSEIRLLTATKVTQVQSIHCEHAYSVPCIPCGCWSSLIGTFRGSDFEGSASQNRTTSTLVTTIVEKERFSDRTTISSQEITPNSVSFLLLTPKVYPQALITFTFLLVLSRKRTARKKTGSFCLVR